MKIPIPARPNRRLGQNFLRDENVLRKILRFFDPQAGDHVLEIGAGTGALTSLLAPHVERLVAVEIDPRLTPFLRTIDRIEVIESDIRKVDLFSIARPNRIRVIGNLPYYISTPILTYLIEHREAVADMTLMFQDEVAERILAEPSGPEYSLISVLVHYYCRVERGFRISRNSFVPRPEVESRLLRFRIQEGSKLNYGDYFLFLTRAFSQRRKKLRNNLLRSLPVRPEALDALFREMNIPETVRAENLSAQQYERLILELPAN